MIRTYQEQITTSKFICVLEGHVEELNCDPCEPSISV